MKIFCCELLKIFVHGETVLNGAIMLAYFANIRAYALFNNPIIASGEELLDYCPFCGAKLPKDLIDERWGTIATELGADYLPDYEGNTLKELPEEFHTDEWWKRRGL